MARSTPLERYEKAAFELAMHDIVMEKGKSIKNMNNPVMDAELEPLYQRSLPEIRKMIRRECRKVRIKTRLQSGVPKVTRVAASALLIMYVGMTAAVAVNDTARAQVAEFLIKVNDEYAELGYWSDETISIPAGWTADYFPAYIPEGYELADVADTGTICTATYFFENDGGAYSDFTAAKSSARATIGTESADIWYEQVNGANAMFIRKGGGHGCSLVEWKPLLHSYAEVCGAGSEKIAESTKLLK